MRKIYKVLCLLAAGLSFASCSEVEPDAFQDITGIYFNNRSNTDVLQDTVDVTFVYQDTDEMDVPVTVQLLGRTSANSRPVSITVASNDAVEGTDYRLPSACELPADATTFTYNVTLLRTAALKQRAKSLTLTIHANDLFALPITHEVSATGDTITSLSYRITFSDMFSQPPSAWEEELLGEFSQQKFELICKVVANVKPSDFNDESIMTLAKQVYIYNEVTAYVSEQVEKRQAGEDYDADAFDATTGEPLSFS